MLIILEPWPMVSPKKIGDQWEEKAKTKGSQRRNKNYMTKNNRWLPG